MSKGQARTAWVGRNSKGPSEAFKGLADGCSIHGLSDGTWSLIDGIEELLARCGPSDVTVSTWTAANADIERAEGLLQDGRIKTLRLLVDRSFESRQPRYCGRARHLFGDQAIRVWNSHAKFVLVLLYNREKQYDKAQRVLYDLKRRYPRNRLVWLEAGSTWLRDDQAHMAERDLALGFHKLQTDERTRMQGEDEMWMLKRGTARVSLRRLDEARQDLTVVRVNSDRAWVQGQAHVELGKIADLEGQRDLARQEYDRGRKLCKKANDRRCARTAETLKKHGYPVD